MKLRTRLVLAGAVLPAALLAAAFVAVGLLLDGLLEKTIDDALLTQAAVQAVSLFDDVDGTPHLHFERSPLASQVRGIAPSGAIYDDTGARVLLYPEGGVAPLRVDDVARVPRTAEPRSVTLAGGVDVREIRVRVEGTDRRAYVLWVGADLSAHEETMRVYALSAGGVLLAVLATLFAVQLWHARRIDARVRALASHLARIRAGDLAAEPAPDDDGDVIGELRAAIAETTVRLRAAREAQERFLAEAAHELRTPLASMRTGIEVALRRERSPDELRAALDRARAESERLGQLATRLLDLAALRAAPIERADVDVRAVAAEAAEAIRAVAEEKGVLVGVEGEPAHAELSEAQLRQALDNLLSNAVRYAPEGSTVDVCVARADGVVRVRVRDRGPGIPEPERERVFAPFHRGEGEPAGAGLGLSIVREVAVRHGGSAYAEAPTEGPGAELVLELRTS